MTNEINSAFPSKRKRDAAPDTEFVNVPRAYVTCLICSDIIHEPVHLDCSCRTNFCAGCIDQWLKKKRTCPACNGTPTEIRSSGRSLGQALDAIKRSCPNDPKCRYKRHSYEDVHDHATNECPYRLVRCPNTECEESVQQKDLKLHLKTCRLRRCKNFRPPRYGCTVMGTHDFIRQHELKCCISSDVLKQLEELIHISSKDG
jgi:hypothetical protein